MGTIQPPADDIRGLLELASKIDRAPDRNTLALGPSVHNDSIDNRYAVTRTVPWQKRVAVPNPEHHDPPNAQMWPGGATKNQVPSTV